MNSNNNLVLLDWEYSRMCSLLYDYLTFWVRMHFNNSVDIGNIVRKTPKTNMDNLAVEIIDNFKNIDNNVPDKLGLYFEIFILERIISHVRAANDQYLRGPLMEEIQKWLRLREILH